jgi:hypothetical protein
MRFGLPAAWKDGASAHNEVGEKIAHGRRPLDAKVVSNERVLEERR